MGNIRRDPNQLTSTATRPLYQPQLGQTTWGSFAEPHRGQLLRAGALSFQLLARRLRVFILDVFFLGTATVRAPQYSSTQIDKPAELSATLAIQADLGLGSYLQDDPDRHCEKFPDPAGVRAAVALSVRREVTQLVQSRPTQVTNLCFAGTFHEISILATFWAKPRTGLVTQQRRAGQRQQHCITNHRRKVESFRL